MLGNMMDYPLTTSSIIQHAVRVHPQQQIVSRRLEGDIHRYSYADAYERIQRLMQVLIQLGVKAGDRVGTLAWNTHRHFELYYAVSALGAIVHTINPRLFAEQIEYIVNHAEDCLLFFDLGFESLIEPLAPRLPTVRTYIALTDLEHMPASGLSNLSCYESLLEQTSPQADWPALDDRQAAALCYTSGTTGHPKGVLYSHRSTVLHALASSLPEALNLNSDTVVMPVVQMYHVCAWGIPYSAPLTGAKLVLPGRQMDGASLWELIDTEQISLLLGVPTVWLTLLAYMKEIGRTLDSVQTVGVGGSASPLSLVKELAEQHEAFLLPIWGMTETSPLATLGAPRQALMQLDKDRRYALQTKAGRAIFGIELEIFDSDNQPLAHDGVAYGSLRVRGPWVLSGYYKDEKPDAFIDGWFDTGDVATIDAEGYLQIVDRKKDVIKSGGEWISSIDLENAAVGHPAVKEACVIGVTHPKWDERPLLFVVLKDGASLDSQTMLDYLAEKVVKWWLPDDVIQLDELPHTATGKLQKLKLREKYQNYLVDKSGD